MFERLRLRRATTGIGAIGVAAAAGQAGAAIVNTGLDVNIGEVDYTGISNNLIGSPLNSLPGASGNSAFGIDDALLSTSRVTLTGNGGTANTTNSYDDAFDVFAGITVNGVAFNQPGGEVDLTTTIEGAFVTTVTPMDIDGVNVSLDYFMDVSSPTLRIFGTFENTGSTSTAIEVAYGGDLSSDSATEINGSSNGDGIFDLTTDRWVITSEGNSGVGSGNVPVLTHVRFGPDGLAPSSTPAAFGTNGTDVDYGKDEFADIWTLSLNSGETQDLMWFVNFNPSVSDALASTDVFDSLGALGNAGLLAGLTTGQVDNVVNWNASLPSPTNVLEPSTASLLGIVLLGVMVNRFIRR